jgi:RNA polymerase sigma-70 factor, ECF subfamily
MNFEKELTLRYKFVRNILMGYCRDADLANDLTQDVMILALRGKDKFTPGPQYSESINAWLSRLARNRYIDHYRSAKKRITQDLDLAKGVADNTENRLMFDDYAKKLQRVLTKRDCNTLMLLGNGYKYREIAQIMGMSEGTVKSSVHSARKRIKNAA